jgi:hypothetical protein
VVPVRHLRTADSSIALLAVSLGVELIDGVLFLHKRILEFEYFVFLLLALFRS